MLLDAIFRHEPLENPQTGISAEIAEADGLFRSGTYVSSETSLKLAAVYSCITVLYKEVIYLILVGTSGNWRELMGFLGVRCDFLI